MVVYICYAMFQFRSLASLLFVFIDDIHSYASPDAICYQKAADTIADHFIVDVEEASEEEYAYCDVDYHHEDIEANAKSLRLAGLGII